MQLLVLLGIFVGYILLGIGVTVLLVKLAGRLGVQRTGKRVVAALGALIFILIPTWDFIPGRMHFNHLCQTEAGLRIYKTVEGVEGFRVERIGGGVAAKEFLDLGYRFIEGSYFLDNKWYRYTQRPDGSIVQHPVEQPVSRYVWVAKGWQPLPWNGKEYGYVVTDLQTQERLAEFRNFHYAGNWALRVIHQNFDTPCPGVSNPHLYKDFLLKTLKPVAATK